MPDQVKPAEVLGAETTHELAFEMWKIVRSSHQRESKTLNDDLALFKLCLATLRGEDWSRNSAWGGTASEH